MDSNGVKPSTVEIQLDKPRSLRFGWNAFIVLQKLFPGKTDEEILSRYFKGEINHREDMPKYLLAGLYHEDRALMADPETSLFRIGEWLDAVPGDTEAHRFLYVHERLTGALLQRAFKATGDSDPGGIRAKVADLFAKLKDGLSTSPSSSEPLADPLDSSRPSSGS